MRAAIYARFSSDLQDLRSIADQVDLVRRYAEARGLGVVDVYNDAAISGASTLNRPGLLRLLADAQARRFEVIITESLDRLSRSQADIASLFERLQFLGVRIETLADVVVSEIHVGLKGTMSALFLKDLAQKTRRGQIGRVKAGRIPGGKSYGYDVLKDGDERGRRAINPAEADIVRRIFREYAWGKGPLAVVRDLNREGVPGPTGRHWNASALLGSPASNVVEFFPKAAQRYRQKVADIHAALGRGEAGDREAVALVRSLIGRIVVHATPASEPLGLEVEGSLAALMAEAPELEHSDISCRMPQQH